MMEIDVEGPKRNSGWVHIPGRVGKPNIVVAHNQWPNDC